MIERPGLELECRPSAAWNAAGASSERVLAFARRAADRLEAEGARGRPLSFVVRRSAPEHVGLGTGTQLGLAVASLIAADLGRDFKDGSKLAELSGRGLRSGIGLHGFSRGGLIVDGGHGQKPGPPPLIARAEFPRDWRVLIVRPEQTDGLYGTEESHAFARLPNVPEPLTDRLCRLVLLGLLPAAAERDLDAFGAALTEMQEHVGLVFAPVQGGPYARAESEPIVAALRKLGLKGVGQSSWGPILYGFTDRDDDYQARISRELDDRFRLSADRAEWTTANLTGACLRALDDSSADA